jgi:DNA-directed RNA polymerase sigma subunit (sigma70/sigma32)
MGLIRVSKLQFSDTLIQHSNKQKGDFNLARALIINTSHSNFEIAQESGVSLERVKQLKQKILRGK